MVKFLCIFLILSLSLGIKAQDEVADSQFELYEEALFSARGNADLNTAFQYLDSIEALGNSYLWKANLIRVDLYRFIEDSLPVALQIAEKCIEHYKKYPKDDLLLYAYEMKLFVSESMRDVTISIESIHEAITISKATNDSAYLSFFEKCLGFFYLHNLSDTTNALKHFNIALETAIQSKDWFYASLVSGELVDYYLFVNHISFARKFANLCVTYSSKIDSTDSNHYGGRIDRGEFFLVVKEYQSAIHDGWLLYKTGIELGNYDNVVWGAYLLTEAYWKTGKIDSAYYYAQIALDRLEGEGGAYELKTQYYWSSKIYAAKGLHKQALQLLERFYDFEKQDYEKLEVKAIARTLYKEELKQKELEKDKIALNLSLTEQQSNFKSLIIAGIFLLCIIIFIYSVVLYKKRQQAIQLNRILAASKEVVLQQKELLVQNIETLKKDLDNIQQDQTNDTFYFSQSAIQLNFSDIIYLESSNNYVLIHIVGRPTPLLERIKMIELIKEFPSSIFIKAHRSYYVNKNHMVARPSKYRFEMSNGVLLNASRSCVENLNGILS